LIKSNIYETLIIQLRVESTMFAKKTFFFLLLFFFKKKPKKNTFDNLFGILCFLIHDMRRENE